jgi:hypothetical protein
MPNATVKRPTVSWPTRWQRPGRSQRKTTASGHGVEVLDDSIAPQRLYVTGYKLSDEMLSAGTLPQIGGTRICSIHAKANCLEPVIAAITAGRPYRHVLGFEAGERSRAAKDALFNTERRVGWYPLIEWNWDRNRCGEFIAATTDRQWAKSACSYCVFAMTTRVGKEKVIERYRREPEAAARALFLEAVARSLNERQTLIAGSSVGSDLGVFPLRRCVGDWLFAGTVCPHRGCTRSVARNARQWRTPTRYSLPRRGLPRNGPG